MFIYITTVEKCSNTETSRIQSFCKAVLGDIMLPCLCFGRSFSQLGCSEHNKQLMLHCFPWCQWCSDYSYPRSILSKTTSTKIPIASLLFYISSYLGALIFLLENIHFLLVSFYIFTPKAQNLPTSFIHQLKSQGPLVITSLLLLGTRRTLQSVFSAALLVQCPKSPINKRLQQPRTLWILELMSKRLPFSSTNTFTESIFQTTALKEQDKISWLLTPLPTRMELVNIT